MATMRWPFSRLPSMTSTARLRPRNWSTVCCCSAGTSRRSAFRSPLAACSMSAAASDYMDITCREDFYQAARVNLVSHRDELRYSMRRSSTSGSRRVQTRPILCGLEEPAPLPEESLYEDLDVGESEAGFEEVTMEQWQPGNTQDFLSDSHEPGWTDQEILTSKDFAQCDERELLLIRRVIAQLAPKIASQLSRRKKSHRRGHLVDHRRTFRGKPQIWRRCAAAVRTRPAVSAKHAWCCSAMSAARWTITAGF